MKTLPRTTPICSIALSLFAFIVLVQATEPVISKKHAIEGEMKVWYPVILTFAGKVANETETTFRDHRLDVTFTKGNKSIRVPGYFAADGNAAESSATSGNKWRVKFTPNEPGEWNYSVSFREVPEIAVPREVTSATAIWAPTEAFITARLWLGSDITWGFDTISVKSMA